MYKKGFLFLFILFLFSCSKTYDSPQEYNESVAKIVIVVQNEVDSLENYLLGLKFSTENLPLDSNFQLNQKFDTILLKKMFDDAVEKTKWAKKEINKHNYKPDSVFKPSVIKGLDMIELNLKENFEPLINIILTSQDITNRELLDSILPFGKKGFVDYQSAMDTIVIGQIKFDRDNKYSLNGPALKFNF